MILETVVIVAGGIFTFLTLMLAFLIFTSIQTLKMQINQIYTATGTMLSKSIQLNSEMVSFHKDFSDFLVLTSKLLDGVESAFSPKVKQVYRTADGKYTADSLEELISKIKSDNKDGKYLSPDDLDDLKKLFEDGSDNFLDNDSDTLE